MLKKYGVGLAFIGVLMFGVGTVNTVLVGSVMATSHEEGKSGDIGQIVDIAQIPAVVKAAIEKETAGGTVKSIVKKEYDGKVCYAVNCVKGGVEKTVKFTADGAVVECKEEKVDIAKVPAVVKAAIEKETAGGTVKSIVKREYDGKVCYAVNCVKGGVEKTVKFTADGAVVECKEEKVDIAKVPAVVKAAIEKEIAGGTVKGIVKKEFDGKVCYAVRYVKDGMEKTAEFTEEGKRK
jgi:hypothetical protein